MKSASEGTPAWGLSQPTPTKAADAPKEKNGPQKKVQPRASATEVWTTVHDNALLFYLHKLRWLLQE